MGSEPDPRRRRLAVVASGLVVAVLLVAATVALWPGDRSTAPPARVPAPPATQPAADPVALQQQLDGVVEAGAPGVVALVRTSQQTWQG